MNVLKGNKKDAKLATLGKWVDRQRQSFVKGTLSGDRIEKLESIGFVWDGEKAKQDILWQKRIKQLEEYKKTHGHCDVPRSNEEFPKLGHWVYRQRENNNNGTLPPERIAQLEAMGFQWSSERKGGRKSASAPSCFARDATDTSALEMLANVASEKRKSFNSWNNGVKEPPEKKH